MVVDFFFCWILAVVVLAQEDEAKDAIGSGGCGDS